MISLLSHGNCTNLDQPRCHPKRSEGSAFAHRQDAGLIFERLHCSYLSSSRPSPGPLNPRSPTHPPLDPPRRRSRVSLPRAGHCARGQAQPGRAALPHCPRLAHQFTHAERGLLDSDDIFNSRGLRRTSRAASYPAGTDFTLPLDPSTNSASTPANSPSRRTSSHSPATTWCRRACTTRPATKTPACPPRPSPCRSM